MPSPGQQSRRFFLAKTLCGSLVAGACGYYGALPFCTSLDRRRFNGLSLSRFCALFSAAATIESLFCFSNSVIKFILTRASYHYYFLHSGERDQRLAKLPEVSTSDGSIRDGVLRAE